MSGRGGESSRSWRTNEGESNQEVGQISGVESSSPVPGTVIERHQYRVGIHGGGFLPQEVRRGPLGNFWIAARIFLLQDLNQEGRENFPGAQPRMGLEDRQHLPHQRIHLGQSIRRLQQSQTCAFSTLAQRVAVKISPDSKWTK